MNYVHHRAVAVHHHTHRAVAERQRCRLADDAECLVAQGCDVNDVQPGRAKFFSQFGATRIHGNTVFGDDNVDTASRSDEGGNFVDNTRYAAAQAADKQ